MIVAPDVLSQIEGQPFPEDFPLDEVIAQLKKLRREVVKSQSWAAEDIRYKTYLPSLEQSADGTPSSFGRVAGHLDKKLQIEANVDIIKALGAVGNAMLSYSGTYKIEGAADAIRVVQKAIVPAELTLKAVDRLVNPNAEDYCYMLPQERCFSLCLGICPTSG